MSEQSEINYLDGDVVWVKLGSCWWPGEVVSADKLPPDILPSFRKPPIAVVKFFQEDTYEYVKNGNSIYKYNCSHKDDFIKKGLYMYRTRHGNMDKFPEDVIRAETATGGDIEILTRDEFQETKKESYAGLFGESAKKTPSSGRAKGAIVHSSKISTPVRRVSREKTDYKVHILVQVPKTPNQTTDASSTPSTSRAESEPLEDKQKVEKSVPTFSSSAVSSSGVYSCHACPFTTSRLNVMIMHNKTHSVTYIPYTPSPVRKKSTTKPPPKSPNLSKTPKIRRPRKEKTDKVPKKSSLKRASNDKPKDTEVKKPKTDEEIKSSLLADWDDGDEESNDESPNMIMVGSPEVAVAAESPAVPTSAELPCAQVPGELSPVIKKSDETSCEKPECSSDSKYEFCEDEDWPLEADAGRKIPRVKNPKKKENTKSLSLDEDNVAREVAELLNKTAVPELPSIPDPLKVEENFPEPSIIKSPDKKSEKSPEQKKTLDKPTIEAQPTKAIFKTKTFFRSRHSRSQDAIGKYVAEQLNAERMDISESDLNGSEAVSSPETRESPPVEHVKVARLAPKIQLKKMKAEAELREREKHNLEKQGGEISWGNTIKTDINKDILELNIGNKSTEKGLPSVQNVLYPTQEIKPVNKGVPSDINVYRNKNEKIPENNTEKINVKIDENKESYTINEALNKIDESSTPAKISETNMQKSYEQSIEYMSESTASAVDALLSVSRDNDRVTKNISNDPPEDLFEDDNKDNIPVTVNGFNESNVFREESNINEEPQNVEKQSEIVKHLNLQRNEMDSLGNFDQSVNLVQNTEAVIKNKETDISDVAEKLPQTDSISKDLQKVSIIDQDIISGSLTTQSTHSDKEIETIKTSDVNSQNVPVVVSPRSPQERILLEDNVPSENNTEIVPLHSDVTSENITDNTPSESDLQIAETLINLPSSTVVPNKITNVQQENKVPTSFVDEEFQEVQPIQEMVIDESNYEAKQQDKPELERNNVDLSKKSLSIQNKDSLNVRFETEQEKSENLNAAQSLVQMSESMDHKITVVENVNSINETVITKPSNIFSTKNDDAEGQNTVEQKIASLSNENNSDSTNGINTKYETTSSKLLKILEEPHIPKVTNTMNKTTSPKQVVVTGKEKILNFDVGKSTIKSKTQSPKEKIIIRRTTTNKTLINNLNEVTADKIILSRSNKPTQDGSSVQTYTIQASPEAQIDTNTIIIQPKMRKIIKPTQSTKITKVKTQTSLVTPFNETKTVIDTPSTEDAMFDINSMPIVLSDDILTPENIEKMPIVMSDGNIITGPSPSNPPKLTKTKQTIIENEKVAISSVSNKQEVKTLLMNPVSDATPINKVTTPNILSKSSKLRGVKPMLVIDKATGKQKIIMTKPESSVKDIKPTPTKLQSVSQGTGKTEKFLILPTTSSSPRSVRTQKIVIDPQTGKAHVLVAKGPDNSNVAENKPVSAKLIPSHSDANPGNTVMIITNAQGTQSRIVLTPEHEKILFPKKQQSSVTQLKPVTHRINNSGGPHKTMLPSVGTTKTTKIVPKQQKSTIITSKGQLIVGGRIATTTQNIAPMPDIRPGPKRIIASEPKKLVQTIQKTSSEPLIFLQQKSGAVMQLTAAQFEHLQRTGQIVPKTTLPENKIVVQKQITIPPKEPFVPLTTHKTKRKPAAESPTLIKKMKQEIIKQEIPITPAPVPIPTSSLPLPALTPLSNTNASASASHVETTITSGYSDLDNFEELLPSTAIARSAPPTTTVTQIEQVAPAAPGVATAPTPAPLSDGQLLAVPGEHFGGPTGSFYLCVEDNGTLTPIDNRPLVLENNQLVPMAIETLSVLAPQPERRDILEAALANSDVFHAETPRDEAPDFRDLNANVSVHCRVSETSTTLNQPIMTPVEVPTKVDSEPAVHSNLEDGLAVIGVTPQTVPTSLELPITVTDPRIALKTTDPLSNTNYGTTLLPSPNTEMTFVTTEETDMSVVGGPISMPLLTEEDTVEAHGKSMPILTDEIAERTASSVGSTVGSPSSIDVRESENEDGGQWSRRLLTPGSDTSETSAEIPLQPAIQLSVNDLSRHS